MKKKILIMLLALLLLVAVGAYLGFRLARDSGRLPELLPELARHLEFELENVRYAHSRAGLKKWELSAARARRLKGAEEIRLEEIKARLFAEGKLESDTGIEAERGFYVVASGDMELEGRIRVVSQQFQITTERLCYREAEEEIQAPGKIFVESEKLDISADSAVIDLPGQKLRMQGRVQAHLRPGAAAPVPADPPLVAPASELTTTPGTDGGMVSGTREKRKRRSRVDIEKAQKP
ncbi:MAG TPA: LPS export ABC transporter periplasmic protein LptC [Proteobacteria bacterium]|nr:LPS export ABC transporter periplasmic protein LptC [Pseudomonadota bacterium]